MPIFPVNEDSHLRVQIEYQKGFENYIDTVTTAVDEISDLEIIDSYWFFWQDYSERFNRHVQLDLLTEEKRETKKKVEEILEEHHKQYYWDKNLISTWYALNDQEAEILREKRIQNSKSALKTLKAYKKGNLEHEPKNLVNRNYHLSANTHGMTHLDELKFCAKRILQIPIIQITNRLGMIEIYNRIFLRKEKENLN